MKLKALILIIITVMFIFAPVSIKISSYSDNASFLLLPLNVCQSADIIFSSNYDNPVIFISPINYISNEFVGYIIDNRITSNKLIFISSLERPPKD
ncbi:MAG: hypothetical protein HQK93_05890 [Nitrospirae bacterium]|nr:hypothetical protein [Nitrospirota bacterium]